MIISIVVIVGVLAIAYMWASKGFLSSLLHMACVIAAGGIALAVFEPLAYMLLETGNRWLIDSAWGMAIAGPFIVSLLVLRVTIDKVVPGNADLDTVTNLVGGGVCGLVSGTVTMGLVMLAVGMMRLSPSLNDYKPIDYQGGGSLGRMNTLMYPVDQLTANFYALMSRSTYKPFGTKETFARWHPEFADEGPMMRTNYNNGFSFHTIEPGGFSLVTRYSVGRNENLKDITQDAKDDAKQSVIDPRGEPVVNPYIEGFVVQFGPKAREESGRVVIGSGQVRLVVEDQQGQSKAYHPFAVISQAQPQAEEDNKRSRGPEYGRWRYNANDVFIGSVGGQNETAMAFEFLLPKGVTPIALYVKGVRVELTGGANVNFATVQERDSKVSDGELLAGAQAKVDEKDLNFDKMVRYNSKPAEGQPHIRTSASLPFNMVLQKDTLHGLSIDEQKEITNGDAMFSAEELKNRVYERTLQVRNFASSDDTMLVQVVMDKSNTDFGLLSAAASSIDRDRAPRLIDSNNLVYTPVGFVYKQATDTRVYFRPAGPITQVSQLPTLSGSRSDQELILIYRVTRGSRLKYFAVGEQVLAEFRPPVDVSR